MAKGGRCLEGVAWEVQLGGASAVSGFWDKTFSVGGYG